MCTADMFLVGYNIARGVYLEGPRMIIYYTAGLPAAEIEERRKA